MASGHGSARTPAHISDLVVRLRNSDEPMDWSNIAERIGKSVGAVKEIYSAEKRRREKAKTLQERAARTAKRIPRRRIADGPRRVEGSAS